MSVYPLIDFRHPWYCQRVTVYDIEIWCVSIKWRKRCNSSLTVCSRLSTDQPWTDISTLKLNVQCLVVPDLVNLGHPIVVLYFFTNRPSVLISRSWCTWTPRARVYLGTMNSIPIGMFSILLGFSGIIIGCLC